ncbi:hypothetical protein B0H66DRAFT_604897 [Apodospora peruviana]|uniref:Uncharacterized protein n=1 Tax=Apodospora peruviana TaxID=516989 RepID=A0AAE0I1X5_9PEZI|nr:hypothetical protein B0H66DRAFT_604897 [Apodospora peruviana]
METRILTTFPTEGLPSPRITPNLRNFPVRHPPGGSRLSPGSAQLNRWFCCQCAAKGYQDPVGMVNNSDSAPPPPLPPSPDGNTNYSSNNTSPERCFQTGCHHQKCNNCLGAASYNMHESAVRTFSGLHASPSFVDPVFWECACGEWVNNLFFPDNGVSIMGISLCNAPSSNAPNHPRSPPGGGCPFRSRGGGGNHHHPGAAAVAAAGAGTLQPDSVVMNVYGQRLGTADQTAAVMGGPWHWQRRGLADPRNAFLSAFRRRAPTPTTHSHMMDGEGSPVWEEGEPVPRYPYRLPPPPLSILMGVPRTLSLSSSQQQQQVDDGSTGDNGGGVGARLAYEVSYLAVIPAAPRDPRDKGKELMKPAAGNDQYPYLGQVGVQIQRPVSGYGRL